VKRVVAIVGVVAVVLVLVWWLRGHRHAGGSTASGTGSASTSGHDSAAHRGPLAPAKLSGKVTRKPDGAPVAGATVSIARAEIGAEFLPSQAPTLIAQTDASGQWTQTIAPGTYLLAATAPGLLPAALPKLVVGEAEQKAGLDFALEAGGTLVDGTVSDVGGGPIAGARVTLKESDEFSLAGRPDFATLTAQDGTYQLQVRDGDYRVSVAHEDYTHAGKSIEVKGKPVVADFTLVPGGSIKGQVIARETGKPVAGAWIDVRGKRTESFAIADAVSDNDGNFQLHSLASGAISLSAAGPGYASNSPTVVELGVGEQLDGITIKVDHAYTISGKVIDKKDPTKGIPAILVGGFSIGSQQAALAHDPTDKDGRFEIVGVRPAGYTLAAFGEGKVPDIGKSVEVVDKDVKDVVIELENGVTLTGRVDPPQTADVGLSLDGEIGLANMFQMAKVAMVHGKADPRTGAFELQHVPAGKLVITADTEDGARGKTPVEIADADQANLVVMLETRASISGTVTDSAGAPAVGAHVNAMRLDEHKPEIDFRGRSGATVAGDGTFKLVGLEPGKYSVAAGWGWSDRFAMYADKKKPDGIVLAKGEQKTGMHLTLDARDGVIHGNVVGADGHPAADAWVSVHPDRGKDMPDFGEFDGGDTAPVLTNADGKFVVDHLKRGTYAIVVDGPRGASRGEKKGVKTGDTVTIELTTLGTLTGHTTAHGAPVTVYDLTCRGPVGPVDRRVTTADGSYSLEHLAPGSYACSVSADQGTARGTVDVPSGNATLDLALTPWASVTGLVVSVLSGQPVTGITVIAGGFENGRGMADVLSGKAPTTDAAGRFRVEHVAAGSGSIVLVPATGGFDQLAKKDFTASEGQLVDVGTIKVVPPRNGDAGTFGLVTAPKDGKLAVVTVAPGGPAEQAGVTTADVITALDGHAISDIGTEPAAALLSSGRIGVGATVALTLERGTTVTLTAAKW
jgi:hypothetical protein